MKNLVGVVENVRTTGPFEGRFVDKKTGEKKPYFIHNITVQGIELTQFGNSNTPTVLPGENVIVLYTESLVNGQQRNKIDKIEVSEAATSPVSKPTPAVPHTRHSTPTSSLPKSGYDPNGARIGMVVKAGLDLAIARQTLTPEGLTHAVADILELTEALESKLDAKGRADHGVVS